MMCLFLVCCCSTFRSLVLAELGTLSHSRCMPEKGAKVNLWACDLTLRVEGDFGVGAIVLAFQWSTLESSEVGFCVPLGGSGAQQVDEELL